ncbi:hypothetical protein FRC03_003201 [Tulasnella sp. 419]|nr:hypothetical protein FRC03_003201 [Tulasnella sp. 419]
MSFKFPFDIDDFVITCASEPDGRVIYQKHPSHFMDDYVVLKVEDALFRVKESLLCQFGVFQEMFRDAATRMRYKMTTEKNPIDMQGISVFEMESLFTVLEARWIDGAPKVNIEQWKAILHFATMWEHDTLRDIAIKKINSLKLLPVAKLGLASKYQVDKWLKPASVELCLRPDPLSYEEGQLLGLPYVLGLSSIREHCCSLQLSYSSCKMCKRETWNCSACNRSVESEGVDRRYSSYPPPYSTISLSAPSCSGTCQDPPPSIESLRKEKANQMVEDLLDTGVRPLPEEREFKRTELPGGWIPKGRHPRFYSDASIIYAVGERAFCTPKNILRTFRALHRAVEKAVAKQPGANVLFSVKTDISVLELSATLDVLNSRWFTGTEVFSFKHWKAALRVATEWDNPELRRVSINMIERIGPKPLNSILLAREYNVPQWLPDAYAKLCMREEPLSGEEGALLGIDTFAKLARIRESRLGSCYACRSTSVSITCKKCRADAERVVSAAVKKLLQKELKTTVRDSVVVKTSAIVAAGRNNGPSK